MISRVTSTESIPKSLASAAVSAERFAAFGPPPLIEGEDGAAYDELLARIRAAVKPVDIIDEMFVADVATIEWEILRWRPEVESDQSEPAYGAAIFLGRGARLPPLPATL
jgi:hypothetical protein